MTKCDCYPVPGPDKVSNYDFKKLCMSFVNDETGKTDDTIIKDYLSESMYFLLFGIDGSADLSMDVIKNRLIRDIDKKYVYENKGLSVSVEESQVAFIKKFNIRYLIVSKNAVVSPKVKALISEEIARDPSGERFYLLKAD